MSPENASRTIVENEDEIENSNPLLKGRVFAIISGGCCIGGIVLLAVGTVQSQMNYRLLRISFVTECVCVFFGICSVVVFIKNERKLAKKANKTSTSQASGSPSVNDNTRRSSTETSVTVISEILSSAKNTPNKKKCGATNAAFQSSDEKESTPCSVKGTKGCEVQRSKVSGVQRFTGDVSDDPMNTGTYKPISGDWI